MNSKNQDTSLFQKDQVIESLKQSFVKLNPKSKAESENHDKESYHVYS